MLAANDPSLWYATTTPVGQGIPPRGESCMSIRSSTTSIASSMGIEKTDEPMGDVIASRRPYRKCRQKGTDQVRRRLDFDNVTDLRVACTWTQFGC